MAALTAATDYQGVQLQEIWPSPYSFKVVNSDTIFAGAFCGLPGANALTSSRGYLVPWQDETNIQWVGYAISQSWTGGTLSQARAGNDPDSVLGDTSASPVQEITCETGVFNMNTVTVTGVSAITDVWRTLVYCSTDNFSDLSTTATSYAPAIGKVIYWHSSTTCAVRFFGMHRMVSLT